MDASHRPSGAACGGWDGWSDKGWVRFEAGPSTLAPADAYRRLSIFLWTGRAAYQVGVGLAARPHDRHHRPPEPAPESGKEQGKGQVLLGGL